MYSDFFDPPDDAAADDKKDEAEETGEGLDYSSGDENVEEQIDEEQNDEEQNDENDEADVSDEQPPAKKTKHNLFADDESV